MQRHGLGQRRRCRLPAVQSQRGLPASAASSRMARIAICICSWPNTTAPSITSSDRPWASDSTISTAGSVPATTRSSCELPELGARSGSAGTGRPLADARGADRAIERQPRRAAAPRRRPAAPGCPHRYPDPATARLRRPALRCGSHPGNSGRIGRSISREVSVSLLGRPAFALEEAARDAPGGVGLLDVVDGEGKEIPTRHGGLLGAGGDQHHRFAHGDEDRAIGLAGELAGLEGDGMLAIGKRLA